MIEDEIEALHRLRGHPWVRHRAALIAGLVRRYAHAPRPAVLEVGCGSGNNLAELAVRLPGARLEGIDTSARAVAICRARGLGGVSRRDLFDMRATARYDAVIMADVLEHIAQDGQALRKAAGLLRPGGILVATVPADPGLYGTRDRALGHHRRYTARMLERLARGAGLGARYMTHWNAILYPPIAGVRRAGVGGAAAGHELDRGGALARFAFDASLGAEGLLIDRGLTLPWGLSLVAVFGRMGMREPRLD